MGTRAVGAVRCRVTSWGISSWRVALRGTIPLGRVPLRWRVSSVLSMLSVLPSCILMCYALDDIA